MTRAHLHAPRPAVFSGTRFYVDTEGADDEAVLLGLRWLLDTAAASQSRAVLAIPQLNNIDGLERSLGETAAELRKRRQVTLEGVVVELAIGRDSRLAADATTLAIWPTDRQLESLDRAGPRAMCVIPWLATDVAGWLASWGAVDLRSGSEAPAAVLSNPVVEAALESLTRRVNLSTGLGHPSDRAGAIGMFQLLRQAGELWEPAEIRAWALSHGWSVNGAGQLEDLGTRIREGRRVRSPSRHGWIENIVELWRQDARERDGAK